MYIFQNALKNVLRNRGRNILLAAIIFAVIATTVVTLMINNASGKIIDEYKNMIGAEVTISRDMSKYMSLLQKGQSVPEITPEQYVSFAESEYIQNSVLINSAMCASDTLEGIGQDSGGMMGSGYVRMPTMRLIGNNWDDFKNGYRELTEGKMPEAKNECIVSSEFAELNNISAGDTIRMVGMVPAEDEGVVLEPAYNLLVTGIYFDGTDAASDSSPMQSGFMNRRNEVLTVYDTLKPDSAGLSVTATYYLKNPDMLADFDAELRGKGLDDTYNVSTDEATYNAVVGPVEGMRGISLAFMIVVLILGAVVLVLLASIAIRERKYEIGVLRAMGMKKSKVALGLWSEITFVTLFCLITGIGAGALIAQPVSDTLLTRQIQNAQEAKESLQGGYFQMEIGGASKTVEDDPIDKVDVSLGRDTLIEIIAVALLLSSVAAVAGISRITKYEPIKILMERN